MRAPTLLADAVERPFLARVLVALGALQVGLFMGGFLSWRCPLRAVSGVPCPGCGLTHAFAALAKGDWEGALGHHALVPVFAAVGVVLLAAAIAPAALRARLAGLVRAVEGRLWLDVLFVVAVGVAWLWRLWRAGG
jgi:hypothetical protein